MSFKGFLIFIFNFFRLWEAIAHPVVYWLPSPYLKALILVGFQRPQGGGSGDFLFNGNRILALWDEFWRWMVRAAQHYRIHLTAGKHALRMLKMANLVSTNRNENMGERLILASFLLLCNPPESSGFYRLHRRTMAELPFPDCFAAPLSRVNARLNCPCIQDTVALGWYITQQGCFQVCSMRVSRFAAGEGNSGSGYLWEDRFEDLGNIVMGCRAILAKQRTVSSRGENTYFKGPAQTECFSFGDINCCRKKVIFTSVTRGRIALSICHLSPSYFNLANDALLSHMP